MPDKKKLKKIVGELKGASKMHASQANRIDSMLKYRTTPLKGLVTSPLAKKGPCWEGYEMIGMKKKGGRTVPNCVPKKK